jgi:hypothetical protein
MPFRENLLNVLVLLAFSALSVYFLFDTNNFRVQLWICSLCISGIGLCLYLLLT